MNPIHSVIRAFSLAVICLTCLSCDRPGELVDAGGQGTVPREEHRDIIFPLATGNSWTYEYQSGELANPPFRALDTFYVSITDMLYWRGYRSNVFGRREYTNVPPSRGTVYGFQDSSLYVVGARHESESFRLESLRYKYPAEVGDTYDWIPVAYGPGRWVIGDTIRVTVASLDAIVDGPTGVYETVMYEYEEPRPEGAGGGNRRREYLAPGLGVVRVDRTSGSSPYRVAQRFELIDYELKE